MPVHSYKEKQTYHIYAHTTSMTTKADKAQLHNALNHVQYEFFQVLQSHQLLRNYHLQWAFFFLAPFQWFHVMLQPESRSCSYHISSKGTMKGKTITIRGEILIQEFVILTYLQIRVQEGSLLFTRNWKL